MRTNRTLVSQSYSTSSESSRRLARITSSLPFIMYAFQPPLHHPSITSSLPFIMYAFQPPLHHPSITSSLPFIMYALQPPLHHPSITSSLPFIMYASQPPLHHPSITSSLPFIMYAFQLHYCAVLLCLVVCLTLFASFFLPSHLSLKHVTCMPITLIHTSRLLSNFQQVYIIYCMYDWCVCVCVSGQACR